MIKHVMADGTSRDSIDGYIIPREISSNLLKIIVRKEIQNGDNNTSRDSKK